MRSAILVFALLPLLGCGSSQPIEPLKGTYAVVFDASFVTPMRAFSGADLESAVKELFAERDGSFQWYHEPPQDKTLFDAVITLHLAAMGRPGSGGVVDNADVSGSMPEVGTGVNLTYEIERTETKRRSFGTLGIHNAITNLGTYEPRMLLDTASDVYAALARELQK
jgi:hypothetical protein